MSMIDYDARPVTPQVLLVGPRASSVGYSIRDFLSRNGVPYEWVDVDDGARVGALLSAAEMGLDQLPVCVLPDGVSRPGFPRDSVVCEGSASHAAL
jgi:thioredoxin reductase (NADPH)